MEHREVTGAADEFAGLIEAAKAALGARGQMVHAYSADEYRAMRLWLAEDKLSGFAVKANGDIVSVWSLAKGRLADMLKIAVEAGGNHLDCFAPLEPVYQRFGFKPVAHDAWNDAYAPADWDYAENGRPDIAYLSLN